MKHVTAIVLAAGRGLRFGPGVPKPLAKINSQPVIIYCLKTLNTHPDIKDIIVVVNAENKKAIVSKIHSYRIAKIRDVVIGGRRRQDSVRNGLRALGSNTDLVLIHDGVRPFIDKDTVSKIIKEAQQCGAAIVGVPVKATIKKIKNKKSKIKNKVSLVIEKTLDRNNLWEAQTPQVFEKSLISEAYEKFSSNTEVTDDAMLVERLGAKVSVVLGSYNNIKITTPEDLVLAKGILKAQSVKRKTQN